MKKKKLITLIAPFLVGAAAAAAFFVIEPSVHEKKCRERVFEDMQAHVDEISPMVIGIIPKTEGADGSVN